MLFHALSGIHELSSKEYTFSYSPIPPTIKTSYSTLSQLFSLQQEIYYSTHLSLGVFSIFGSTHNLFAATILISEHRNRSITQTSINSQNQTKTISLLIFLCIV